MENWFNQETKNVIEKLNSNLEKGLTEEQFEVVFEEFKQYYKFPLKMWEFMEIKVFTDDNKMAFDWLVNIPRDTKQKLIDRINGINIEPYKTIRLRYRQKHDAPK